MLRKAIDLYRRLPGKAKKILGGLLCYGVNEIFESVPVVGSAVRLVRELADFGTDRLTDAGVDLGDLKAVGETYDDERLDAIESWLANLTTSMQGLEARLEEIVIVRDGDPWEKVSAAVADALKERQDLAEEFARHQHELQKQTLSLHRIEEQLSRFFHEQRGVHRGLEEIKEFLIASPQANEWAEFRKADPEGVRLLNEADALILKGQRTEGEKRMLDLLRRRGIGTTIIARHLGLRRFAEGRLEDAKVVLEQAGAAAPLPPTVTATLAMFTTQRSQPSAKAWTSLPRGFLVANKYRIEEEIGRGGMGSVYRAVGVDHVNQGEVFAIKVPAPGLVEDDATAQRFVQEIKLSLRLSKEAQRQTKPPPIVATLDYAVFTDPQAGKKAYGLVLEFVAGRSLARLIAQRQAANKPFTPAQIRTVLTTVCQALEFAHAQVPPILHRDVKSANVLLTAEGGARLTDFGIARVLDDCADRPTRPGQVAGTLGLMPVELFDPDPTTKLDGRVDVFMLGKLLRELMTFSLYGDPTRRSDCPAGWVKLIASATNEIRDERPATVREFRERLAAADAAPPPPPPPPPVYDPVAQKQRDLESIRAANEAARKCAAAHDPEAGVAVFEKLEERLRKRADAELYTRLVAQRDRLAEMEHKIEAQASDLSFTRALARLIHELLALKPGHWMQRYLAMCPGDRKAGELETLDLGAGVALKFAWVPPGTFYMGGGGGTPGSQQVEIAQGFALGIYPVTQEQWQAVMGSNPSAFSRAGGSKDKVKGIPDAELRQFPVESVSWEDAQAFIAKLNERCHGGDWLYRLPAEAEWEYACRGAVHSQAECSFHFYFDRPTNDLSSAMANFDGNHPEGGAPKGKYLERPTRVGSYKPNRLGLYDMHGNVWEWCEDWSEGGSIRGCLGGGWNCHGSRCQSADRGRAPPADRYSSGASALPESPSSSKAGKQQVAEPGAQGRKVSGTK